jgi:hypothetical protein
LSIKESLRNLKDNTNVNINYIEPKSGIIIKTILVDKKHSLVMELKDKEDYSTAEEQKNPSINPTISKLETEAGSSSNSRNRNINLFQ